MMVEEKMDGGSFDETAASIAAVKNLFPQAVREGKIDFDVLKTCLGGAVEERKDFYRLLWNGKEEARAFSRTRSQATLLPCRAESKNWDETQNLYIEGDNLEVLKLLQGAYHNQVKMIYIDPPYNTGKDFVYHDNFHDSVENYKALTGQVDAEGKKTSAKNAETSGRYHTDWLNMIFPRLLVARNLLRDDGVIFISIDDNEVSNLRKVCDEVFGEDNFVAQLVWDLGTGTQAGHFVRAHEYVVAYFKNKSLIPNFKGGEGIIEHSALKKISQKNPASDFPFPAGTRWDAPDGTKLVGTWGGSEATTLVKGDMECKDGRLTNDVVLSAGWCMAAQMRSWFAGNETYDTKGQLVKSFYFNEKGILRYEKDRSVVNPPTVLRSVGSTKNGTDEVEGLLGAKVFDYPKPTTLCMFLARLTTHDDDVILDMFSGSSSFADAVMRLNAGEECCGRRRYVAIQMPEDLDLALKYADENAKSTLEKGIDFCKQMKVKHTLCEIGKERIRRAGEKVLAELKQREAEKDGKLPMDGATNVASVQPDVGFRVFKLETSNIVAWNPKAEDIEQELINAEDNIVAGRTREDLLYEILLKSNVMLTAKIEERKVAEKVIYVVDGGKLMVALDDRIGVEVADEMARIWREEIGSADAQKRVPPVVVFRETGFRSDEDKANALTTLKSAGFETVRTV